MYEPNQHLTTADQVDMESINAALGQPDTFHDAGNRAAEVIRKRSKAAAAMRALMVTIAMCALLVSIGAAGIGYYGYTSTVAREVTDSRPCKLKVGEHLVTGVREYTRTEYRTLGLSFTKDEEIEEVTKLNVEYVPMTILGITDNQGWDIPIVVAAGEKGFQTLPQADLYTFFVKDAAVAVQYSKLCK